MLQRPPSGERKTCFIGSESDKPGGAVFVPVELVGVVSLFAFAGPLTMTIMRAFGKLLQVMALILLPFSMFMEMSGGLGRRFGVSDMVVMLVFGIAAFCVGRFVEGYARG